MIKPPVSANGQFVQAYAQTRQYESVGYVIDRPFLDDHLRRGADGIVGSSVSAGDQPQATFAGQLRSVNIKFNLHFL